MADAGGASGAGAGAADITAREEGSADRYSAVGDTGGSLGNGDGVSAEAGDVATNGGGITATCAEVWGGIDMQRQDDGSPSPPPDTQGAGGAPQY